MLLIEQIHAQDHPSIGQESENDIVCLCQTGPEQISLAGEALKKGVRSHQFSIGTHPVHNNLPSSSNLF